MQAVAERVLIVSRIYRPEPSAASFFLGSVADALLDAGHEVDVLTVRPPVGLGDGSRGERIRTFPVLRDRSGYVRGYIQYLSFDLPLFFRLLFAKRPAVVFVEPPPTTGAIVRMVCALRRIPYVYDAADIWSDAASHATASRFVVRALRAVEKFAMRGAQAMTTISQGVVQRVRSLGIRTPMTVTGFGADTSAFHYSPETIEPTFLYAGTYTGLHGASILIEAFALMLTTHPGHRLRFIGNGTEQNDMRERAEALGVAAYVEFCDPVAPEELSPQLNRAIASLATLHPDGGYEYAFTSKIYSSLASGCPVIFAGPGPTAAFIESATARVPLGKAVPYEARAIADAMIDAADDQLSADERKNLASWAAAEHSMQATARGVRDVLVAVSRPRKGRKS